MDLAQCGSIRHSGKMQQYQDLKCGTNVPLENCLFYQYKVKQDPNNSNWKFIMNNSKCEDILKQYQNSAFDEVYGTYSDIDKKRIETESKYQRNKKIFIGGMVLLVVLGIVLTKKLK